MPTALFSLAQVKAILDIPSTDTAYDTELTSLVDGVQTWVLEQTHIDLNGGASYTELHRDVQIGRPFDLDWRPVASISGITGRFYGGDAMTLEYDILDLTGGQVVLIGANNFRVWPPAVTERPPWMLWREKVWPLVTVSYTTAALPVPSDLSNAAAAIAAAWWGQHKAGLRSYIAFGSVIERYGTDVLPISTLAVLRSYQRRKAYATP